jgi:hypothetical protein
VESRADTSTSAEYDQQLHAAMTKLVSNFPLRAGTAVEHTLASITAAAVELIGGVDHADVLLIDDGRFDSVAPTAPIAKELDAIQQLLEEGALPAGRHYRPGGPLHGSA